MAIIVNNGNKNMIIGVVGFINSGKDTIADYLTNFHGFRRESFASTLKDAVSQVFGWDRTLLEGRTKQAREWRERVDPWWAERLNMPTLTPRWILQYWGTEVCRAGFHDDIWIAALQSRLARRSDHTVISDVRFPNEIKAIKEQGGKIVWIQRGELPSWHILAAKANAGDLYAQTKLKELGVHASETSWVGTNFDSILDNNGSIEGLYTQLKNLVQSPQASKEDVISLSLVDSLSIQS
jgi:hypothetical protein